MDVGFKKGYYDFCKDYVDASNTTMSLLVGFNTEAEQFSRNTLFFVRGK